MEEMIRDRRVVLFGEMLPEEKLTLLDEQTSKGFDLVFSVGTSSLFAYITMPVIQAARRGTPTVEINPDRTIISDTVSVRLEARAAVALGELWRRFAG